MPGVRIGDQLVSSRVVFAVLHVVRADFLQETFISVLVPSREEQPGPPLSHSVTGSLLFGPFTDSTNT